MTDYTPVLVLITVRGGARPFAVLPITQEQRDAAPGSMVRAKVRDAVQCTDLRAAYSYANGFRAGFGHSGDRRAISIYRDQVLATAEEIDSPAQFGPQFVAVNLDRTGG